MSATARRWLAVGLALLALLAWSRPPPSGPPAGTPAPALSLPLLDGGSFTLEEQRGRPVVLAFWATWCPACRAEAPELARAERELAAGGGALVAVSVDTMRPTEIAAEAARLGMPSRVARAGPDVVSRFGITLLPTTIVVAPDGTIAHVFTGAARAAEILDAVHAAGERGRDR